MGGEQTLSDVGLTETDKIHAVLLLLLRSRLQDKVAWERRHHCWQGELRRVAGRPIDERCRNQVKVFKTEQKGYELRDWA